MLLMMLLLSAAEGETVRSLLMGDRPGSLEMPIDLVDPKSTAEVCSEVSRRSPVDTTDDSAESDLAEEKWEAARRIVFARVYRTQVEPKSVRFNAYDPVEGVLPIAIDRAIPALDGALLLSLMSRDSPGFEVTAEEAKQLVLRSEKKELRLLITFQVDPEKAEELSPCWSYPKSETWSLRVVPLRVVLTDPAGATLASATTDRMKELGEWIENKGRGPAVSAQVVRGVVDQAALDKAIKDKTSEIATCVSRAGETATFGLVAGVANGKLDDVRIEMEASDDPQAGACLVALLSRVAVPKASKDSTISVVVSAD